MEAALFRFAAALSLPEAADGLREAVFCAPEVFFLSAIAVCSLPSGRKPDDIFFASPGTSPGAFMCSGIRFPQFSRGSERHSRHDVDARVRLDNGNHDDGNAEDSGIDDERNQLIARDHPPQQLDGEEADDGGDEHPDDERGDGHGLLRLDGVEQLKPASTRFQLYLNAAELISRPRFFFGCLPVPSLDTTKRAKNRLKIVDDMLATADLVECTSLFAGVNNAWIWKK